MPLVGAAIVPHSPLLVEAVAKDHAALGDECRAGMRLVAQHFRQVRTEVVVFFTPHAEGFANSIGLYLGDALEGSLREFGNLSNYRYRNAVATVQSFRDAALKEGLATHVRESTSIDYGVTVPAGFVVPPDCAATGIGVGTLESESLIRLGRVIHETLHETRARVAVVASADFSRERKTRADRRPGPLERNVVHALQSRRVADLPPIQAASPCGLRAVYPLTSLLEGVPGGLEVIGVSAPYGIWYITGVLST